MLILIRAPPIVDGGGRGRKSAVWTFRGSLGAVARFQEDQTSSRARLLPIRSPSAVCLSNQGRFFSSSVCYGRKGANVIWWRKSWSGRCDAGRVVLVSACSRWSFGRCPAVRTKCSLSFRWRAWVGRVLGSRLCSPAACHRALWDAVSSSFQVDGGRQLASTLPVACLTNILLKISWVFLLEYSSTHSSSIPAAIQSYF